MREAPSRPPVVWALAVYRTLSSCGHGVFLWWLERVKERIDSGGQALAQAAQLARELDELRAVEHWLAARTQAGIFCGAGLELAAGGGEGDMHAALVLHVADAR